MTNPAIRQELDRWVDLAVAADAVTVGGVPDQWSPHKPYGRQTLFLHDLHDEKEVFYGGAAGGMKSDALLQCALEYVDIPGYSALLLRRTYSDLSKSGALMDRARTWLLGTKAKPIDGGKSWRFPSGAILAFGYLENENDKEQYQSAEYQFIGFDELTQFTETQYTYLFSRLRRPSIPCKNCFLPLSDDGGWHHVADEEKGKGPVDCIEPVPNPETLKQYGPDSEGRRIWDIPLRMRAASNPAGDHTGYWVATRFVPDTFTPEDAAEPRIFWKEGTDARGRVARRAFVPSRLEDNPFLDQAEYEESLAELGGVTYEQLRRGDWQIKAKGNVLTMWDEQYHVISWSQFEKVFGIRGVPPHWQCGISQDWGTTASHPCVTTVFATAAANSALPGAVFVVGGLTLYNAEDAQQVATDHLIPMLDRLRIRDRIGLWLMSHEAKSELNSYRKMGLPFNQWGQDSCGGLDQVKRYLKLTNRKQVNLFEKRDRFGEMLYGTPMLLFVVNDDQLIHARDDSGLARHRTEAAGYSWHIPKAGEPPEKLRPQKLFNDAMDGLRCYAAIGFPRIADLTKDEKIRAMIPDEYKPEHPEELPPAERAATEQGFYFAYHKARKKIESADTGRGAYAQAQARYLKR